MMNSMSKYYYDSCGKERRKERIEEKCPTIIKCGCPSSVTIPAGTAAGATPFTPVSYSHLDVYNRQVLFFKVTI